MARTIQDLIEQARLKEQFEEQDIEIRKDLFKTARKGIRAENIERFRKSFSRPRSVPRSVRKLDESISEKLRKAVHLVAPKKSMVRRLTKAPGKKGKGGGRGRPEGTFKTRVLPSGKVVKVPTHIFNKMKSAELRNRRLAIAQQQAYIQQQQEQIAITQDPRFQPERDGFLESPDMQHEQNVEAEQQRQFAMENLQSMQQQQPQGGFVQRAGNIMRRLGAGVNRLGGMGQVRGQPQQLQGQPRQIPRTMEEARQIKASQNILNVPFIFGASQQIDTPGAKISLMDTDRRNQQIIAREEYMKDLQRRTDPNYGKSSILNTNVQENILNAQSPTGRVIGF